MQLNSLSREQKIEAITLLEEKLRRLNRQRIQIAFDSFYGWQRSFVRATSVYDECCLCAANQIGKTYLGTLIDAAHLTGDYPDGWDGHRFDFAPTIWCLGYSMEKTRDLLQTALFGKYRNGEFEGGLIPAERIVDKESATGTPNAMRSVWVKHATGGKSLVQFWSYSQGQHAIMGDVVDFVHIDEEPEDQEIRPQVVTRTINGDRGKGGRIIYTFTPENGRTDLVIMFSDDPAKSQFFMNKGWNDAPHMTQEKREKLLAKYPAHQRPMRSEGVPMLGHGRIYDMGDETILCDRFEIPDHWYIIGGMDFGWTHPQAHVRLVEDRDTGIFYLTHAWKASKISAADAWSTVKKWPKAPASWPADGLQNEKGRKDAVQQKKHYQDAGFQMLAQHACWPDMPDGRGGMIKGGVSVETGIYELNNLMTTGKFKVFRGLNDFMEEWRMYHRDEKGNIVKVKDDLLDAVRYAYMMRRFAKRYGETKHSQSVYIPKPLPTVNSYRR